MKRLLTLLFVSLMSQAAATPYIPMNDPMLREKVKTVAPEEIGSPELEAIIEQMLSIAREERKNEAMVGLAAPQIGISKAIILVDMKITEARESEAFHIDPVVYINPRVVWASEEIVEYREGCYSTGKLRGIVPRPRAVKIEALDREGNSVSLQVENYTARIFQHEIDHLNGKRFPDRLSDFSKLHIVEEGEGEEYPEKFQTWPRSCSREEWLSLIGGK